MRIFNIKCFLVLALLLSFLKASAQIAKDPSDIKNLAPLGKWLESQQDVISAKADFIQSRKLAALDREIKTSGKLWIKYPDKFHWQMGIPTKANIIRNGSDMQFINIRKNTISSFKAKSSEGRRYAFMTSKFAPNLKDFLTSFTVKRVWEEKGVHYLLFQPKQSKLKKRVPFLALGIIKKQNKLILFEMHLQDKSIIRTTFSNYQTNVSVDDSKFILKN